MKLSELMRKRNAGLYDAHHYADAVEKVEAVAKYAQHRPWCTHCDCGFNDVLEELEEKDDEATVHTDTRRGRVADGMD